MALILPGSGLAGKGGYVEVSLLSALLALDALCLSNKGL